MNSKKPATSSFLQDDSKAMYQPWRHGAFKADIFVMAMKPAQRWMYQTLLHEAFDYATRPYLPDDDNILWMLAGCESKKQWDQNKDVVRARFTPVKIQGADLLSQKRLLEDWARLGQARQSRHEAAKIGGKASAAKRQRIVNESLTDGQPNPTERQRISTKRSEVKRSEVKGSEANQPSVDGGLAGSSATPEAEGKGAGSIKKLAVTFDDLQATWTEVRESEDSMSIALPRTGIIKLQDALEQLNLLDRVDGVKSAFSRWLKERYIPALDKSNEIHSPLAVFSDEVQLYFAAVVVDR
jgi:hypothetical protein